MNQHMMERTFSGLLISGKHHTNHPEKDNIISGYQYVRGIKIIQLLCILWPPQRGEGPQRGGKPCIQRIRILCQTGTPAFGTDSRRFFGDNDLSAVVAIVSRYPVSPPELTGNTPVTDIFQPVQVNFVKTLRYKGKFSVFYRLHGRFGQFIHLYKPLLFDQRLHRSPASVMGSYVVGMIRHFHKKPLFLKVLHNGGPGLIAFHTVIPAARTADGGIVVHDIDLRQIVPFSHLKVVGVVSRCDLYTAGTKFLIHIGVRYYRNLPVCQRKL